MSSSTSSSDLRTFLVRTTLWIAGLVLFAVSSIALNRRMLEGHVDPGLAEARVLLAGDSHAETGFDASRWDQGLNVALQGEPLVATLHKLRFLTPCAPALEEIVVSVGPQSIARFRDGHLDHGPRASQLLERLYGVMPFWTLGDTPVSRELAFAASLRKWWSPDLHLIRDQIGQGTPDHPYANGFVPREGTDLSDERFTATMSTHYPEGDPRTSPIQMKLLDSIVDHGRAAGVRVTLVATPLHPRYRQAVPRPVDAALDSLFATYLREGSARILDLRAAPFPDSLFWDFNHVNRRGAGVLSDIIVAAEGALLPCASWVPTPLLDGRAPSQRPVEDASVGQSTSNAAAGLPSLPSVSHQDCAEHWRIQGVEDASES